MYNRATVPHWHLISGRRLIPTYSKSSFIHYLAICVAILCISRTSEIDMDLYSKRLSRWQYRQQEGGNGDFNQAERPFPTISPSRNHRSSPDSSRCS